MSRYDHRTEKGKANDFSFYVYDDLRAQQKGNSSDIFYFDSIEEAVSKYNSLDRGMTTALGISFNHKPCDMDIIQRREGEDVLIHDFLNSEVTRLDPRVHEAALDLCEMLKVQWELDHMLGNSILVPREYGLEPLYCGAVHEPYFDNKRLDYFVWNAAIGKYLLHDGGAQTAIQEVYLRDEENAGYMPFKMFKKMISDSKDGYLLEHRPKVGSFYINYVDDKGNFGGADVRPHTLRELLNRERYLQQTADRYMRSVGKQVSALEELAHDIDQFVYDFDYYSYRDESAELPGGGMDREANVQQVLADLAKGDASAQRAYLEETLNGDRNDPWRQIAQQLLNKLDSACPAKGRSLDHILDEASEERSKRSQNHKTAEKTAHDKGRDSAP